jgi:DNA-binding XRE family transcriptional regulator
MAMRASTPTLRLSGSRANRLRAEHGWSQAHLADLLDLLDVSRQTVNAIETGRYDPSLPLVFDDEYRLRSVRPRDGGAFGDQRRQAADGAGRRQLGIADRLAGEDAAFRSEARTALCSLPYLRTAE